MVANIGVILTPSTLSVRRVIGGPTLFREQVQVLWLELLYYFSSYLTVAWKCSGFPQVNLLHGSNCINFRVLVRCKCAYMISSRGYQGVGPTIDERYIKKSKVLPDPVPRNEMEH